MSSWLVNALILSVTVVGMEYFAWAMHRYVMHGWGWGWHRSHHEPGRGLLEKNDLYTLVFAGIAIGFIVHGAADHGPTYWIGMGATVYGVLYFIVHEGMVHKRWPFRYIPRKGYLKRLYQAHRMHHAVHGREGCVSFGFLIAPPIQTIRAQLKENIRSGRARVSER